MSTHWWFTCTEHDPPLRSEEFTQHTDDAYYDDGIRLALARPVADFSSDDGYFQRNARTFLHEHPRCPLLAVSENGERRSVLEVGSTMEQQEMLRLRAEVNELWGQLSSRRDRLQELQGKLQWQEITRATNEGRWQENDHSEPESRQ